MRLIDADALYEKVTKEIGFPGWNIIPHAIEEAPTIDDVTVVHGRWVVYTDEDEYAFSEYFKCSICGATHYNDDNYCPNCGAKMDGEAD